MDQGERQREQHERERKARHLAAHVISRPLHHVPDAVAKPLGHVAVRDQHAGFGTPDRRRVARQEGPNQHVPGLRNSREGVVAAGNLLHRAILQCQHLCEPLVRARSSRRDDGERRLDLLQHRRWGRRLECVRTRGRPRRAHGLELFNTLLSKRGTPRELVVERDQP
jgi:hypothetical protein